MTFETWRSELECTGKNYRLDKDLRERGVNF